jgi:hypothetical protein
MELYLTLVHHNTTACVITMDVPILGDILGAPGSTAAAGGSTLGTAMGTPPLSPLSTR